MGREAEHAHHQMKSVLWPQAQTGSSAYLSEQRRHLKLHELSPSYLCGWHGCQLLGPEALEEEMTVDGLFVPSAFLTRKLPRVQA